MESSSHTDEDIKEECVEIISTVDAESVGNATAMFMSGENEPSMESNAVYMNDDQEALPGTSGSSTTILLERDRDGSMVKPVRETVVTLIELVRGQPEIWDINNAAYKEKLLRRRSFRRVADELGWSTEDVIKKYNNLRTYYTKEVIKQKRSPSYQSKWPYFERLDSFLRRTVHRRQPPSLASRMSRLASRNAPDRWSSHESSQLQVPSGFRRKRQMFNSGDVRHLRNNFTRAAATLSAPPVEISRQSSAPLTSSAGTRGSQASQINISQVRSLAPQQPPRETVSSTPPSAVQSRGLQMQVQKKQNQPQPQQQQHPQQLQQQHAKPMSPPSSASNTAASSPMSQPYQSASTMLPSPSSGQPLMESNDVIFGRLVTSQLSKIKEGRKKEQLKINLMQQLVQAMFDDEQP